MTILGDPVLRELAHKKVGHEGSEAVVPTMVSDERMNK
jgi:hypothetical protein